MKENWTSPEFPVTAGAPSKLAKMWEHCPKSLLPAFSLLRFRNRLTRALSAPQVKAGVRLRINCGPPPAFDYATNLLLMSRFYDALRQAGHLRRDGAIPDLEWIPERNGTTDIALDPTQPESANGIISGGDESAAGESRPKLPEIGPIHLPLAGSYSRKALIRNGVDPVVMEHYRRLRTKIIQLQEQQHFRSLMVTSPNPEEGKTVTVLNLAMSFGLLYDYKILVVDADLRRSSLGKWLGARERPGFSNLIDGSAQLSDVIWTFDEVPISFMPSGSSKVPPAELLQSAHLRELMERLMDRYSLVLIDSPPVNIITDGQLLAASCDAVLLVVRAFLSTRKAVERAVEDLPENRIIGTILNGGARVSNYHRYSGYY